MSTTDIIRDLCADRKKSMTELEKELNFGNGSLTKNNYMRSDRLKIVADYFGVTMDYLMTGQEPAAGPGSGSSPAASPAPSRYSLINKRLDLLNDEGLSKVMDYTNDLVETGKYAVNAVKKEA